MVVLPRRKTCPHRRVDRLVTRNMVEGLQQIKEGGSHHVSAVAHSLHAKATLDTT